MRRTNRPPHDFRPGGACRETMSAGRSVSTIFGFFLSKAASSSLVHRAHPNLLVGLGSLPSRNQRSIVSFETPNSWATWRLLMNLGGIRRVIFGHDSITVLTGSPRHDATAIGQN